MRSIITRVVAAVLIVITAFSAALAYNAVSQRRLVADLTRINQGYVPIARLLDDLSEELRSFARVLSSRDPQTLRQSIRASQALFPIQDRADAQLEALHDAVARRAKAAKGPAPEPAAGSRGKGKGASKPRAGGERKSAGSRSRANDERGGEAPKSRAGAGRSSAAPKSRTNDARGTSKAGAGSARAGSSRTSSKTSGTGGGRAGSKTGGTGGGRAGSKNGGAGGGRAGSKNGGTGGGRAGSSGSPKKGNRRS